MYVYGAICCWYGAGVGGGCRHAGSRGDGTAAYKWLPILPPPPKTATITTTNTLTTSTKKSNNNLYLHSRSHSKTTAATSAVPAADGAINLRPIAVAAAVPAAAEAARQDPTASRP